LTNVHAYAARGSDERFAPVLALFDHHNYREITRADAEKVLGVGTTQAVNTLRDMLDEELIRKVGNGRLTRYVGGHHNNS
jgi:ATP-dependent DNA helicase RecG